MDPKACLERFEQAIADDDWDEANAAYNDLCWWYQRGGWTFARGSDEARRWAACVSTLNSHNEEF